MPSPEDAATLMALTQGVDHIAVECEHRWGVGRLPLLVTAEMRAKFIRQGDRWRDAMEAAWNSPMLTRDQIDAVKSTTGGMERAWRALDAQAKADGAKAIDPDIWEVALADGSIAQIVRTNAEASAVIREGRALSVWTLDEIGRCIDLMPEMVRVAKETFPGATVMPKRERASGKLDDPIPW